MIDLDAMCKQANARIVRFATNSAGQHKLALSRKAQAMQGASLTQPLFIRVRRPVQYVLRVRENE